MGVLVKNGLVERDLVLDVWATSIPGDWDRLKPLTALYRRTQGDAVWENFEYLVVLSEDWVAAHPKGAYPSGVRRLNLKDEWLAADTQYAASRTPG